MKYNSVLFDLDGTLLDTADGVLTSINHISKQEKLMEVSHEDLLTFIGPPMYISYKRVFKVEEEKARKLAEITRDWYLKNSLFIATMYDGIIELIKRLHENGVKIAVATYKRQDCADSIIEHFGIKQYCTCVIGADNEAKLTKQDIINMCIKEMSGEDKSSTVMIGDSDFDAIGAKQAGVDFIAVTYGYGFKNLSEVDKYDYVFKSEKAQEVEKYLFNEL